MMHPEINLALAKARQAELRQTTKRRSPASGANPERRTRRGAYRSPSPPDRGLLLARASELVSLASRSGCTRDELVRMIQTLS